MIHIVQKNNSAVVSQMVFIIKKLIKANLVVLSALK